jgi:hypothetical protein
MGCEAYVLFGWGLTILHLGLVEDHLYLLDFEGWSTASTLFQSFLLI